MLEHNFTSILMQDEEVKFVQGVDKRAYTIKKTISNILVVLIADIFISQFVTVFGNMFTMGDMGFIAWPITFGIVLLLGMPVAFLFASLSANNTFFCITDKRIILKYGVFNFKFIDYSIRNIGTTSVQGSVFDTQGEHASANLVIVTKNFHNDTNSKEAHTAVKVISLVDAYYAYKLLNEMTQGHDEVYRIKMEQ